MKRSPVEALAFLHDRLILQFSVLSEQELRLQYHPDLSQLGWHLSHIAFIEQYWLREVVLGDNSRTAELHQYYFPENIDKSVRGELPGITGFTQLRERFSETEKLLSFLLSGQQEHPLLEKDYIGWFLVQHGQQHFETMQLVVHQKTLKSHVVSNFVAVKLDTRSTCLPSVQIPAGCYKVGSDHVLACDNEQPVHQVELSAFRIAAHAVSNAEYMGFIQQGAYQDEMYWGREGWAWVSEKEIYAPESWVHDDSGSWYEITPAGPRNLHPEAAVSGLSWYEADAFARYAGCRLPHEFEWEVAMKDDQRLLQSTGDVWEWCSNTFFAYEGFQAFPYERYSSPWFDSGHYTLKGASCLSGETVRLPSFRNFYSPDKRHVFAGLRLVCDA